jgi:hypothetical protein
MPTVPPINFEQRSYASGMNAAALPSAAMKPDELSLIINGTVRNGYLRTRPAWHWQPLSFLSSEAQLIFETGRYQGSEFCMSDQGNVFFYAIDGHIFLLDPQTWFVLKLTDKPAFSKFAPHVWIKQRNKWVIAQDGIAPPWVFDGVNSTQEHTTDGVPTGTIMAEGWGRLAVVSPDRRRIYFSNHEMDPNATPISFTEGTSYFLAARYFEVPASLGKIMGMAFTPYQDTSTGIGPLVVFCEKGTRAYNVAVPRTQWVQADIGQTILPRVGASSHFAFADRGSELVFRDQDGRIRTIRNAQQVEATDSNFPNDFSIWPLVESEDATLRKYSQAVTYDGRVLVLTHPQPTFLLDQRYNVGHRGIAVLENETLSDKPDVWAFWTGFNICGLDVGPVNGEEVCLGFCCGDKNRIYGLTKKGLFDMVPGEAGAVSKRIQMTFSTPYSDFLAPVAAKKVKAGGMRMTGMHGRIDITGRWERDGKQPLPWFNHAELHPSCMVWGTKKDCKLTTMAPGINPKLVFPAVPDKDSSFYKARMTFDVCGPIQVEEMALSADLQTTGITNNVSCEAKPVGTAQVMCGVDIFAYDANLAPIVPQTNIKPCLP